MVFAAATGGCLYDFDNLAEELKLEYWLKLCFVGENLRIHVTSSTKTSKDRMTMLGSPLSGGSKDNMTAVGGFSSLLEAL